MVMKNREYYGICGFHVPSFPRAPRSARGRGLHKKKVEDNQLCAIELLASLAGKLLQESESSSASSNASEATDRCTIGDDIIKLEQDELKPQKTEHNDHGSCEESIFIPEFARHEKSIVKDFPHFESDSIMEHSSTIANSASSKKVGDVISAICKSKTKCENFTGKVENYSDSGQYYGGHVENELNRQKGDDRMRTGSLTLDSNCSSKDPTELCMKFPPLMNSNNDVKLSLCRDPVLNASILRHRNHVKLCVRDDDENFFRYNTSSKKLKAFRPPLRIRERRIRKLLTSRHWKVAPKLKDYENSKSDWGTKSLCRKRKPFYRCERHQHDHLCKRRKFSDNGLVVTSDGGFSSESVCNSPEKGVNGNKNCSEIVFPGANGVSYAVIGHQASFHSMDSHVKFSIKSIRVPELFIEVPETETVGSLKRTVLEAVSALVGGGLRVGMVLQGKKVRDDSRTLLQTGISKDNLGTLGFTLEPSAVQAPPPECNEDPPHLLPCDTSQPISRSPATPILDSGISDAVPDAPPLTNLAENIESNHESDFSQTGIVTDKTNPDARALVAVPPASADALALVPANQKSRRSELVQRRTRRPFSVPEVEALVQAVEELGTGRWRDVKLCSFENADHRTYVDLKDKWKTLVHTAKITPQQRRGEPVPQVLLDRVLAAHAYWSQHQAKQHSKNQAAVLKITEAHPVRSGGEGIHLI